MITEITCRVPWTVSSWLMQYGNRWAPVEIIVMSGKSRPNDDDLPARGMFFSKPVDERLLRQALRNIQT